MLEQFLCQFCRTQSRGAGGVSYRVQMAASGMAVTLAEVTAALG